MKPDEVAREFAARIGCESSLPDWAKAMITDWVREAVRAAVAAETERCARVAQWIVDEIEPQGPGVAEAIRTGRCGCIRSFQV